jgi:hypothetical protein
MHASTTKTGRMFYVMYALIDKRTSKAIVSKLSAAKYLLLLSSGRLGLFLRRRLYLSDRKVHTIAIAATESVMLPPVSLRGILCLDPRQISDVCSSPQHHNGPTACLPSFYALCTRNIRTGLSSRQRK